MIPTIILTILLGLIGALLWGARVARMNSLALEGPRDMDALAERLGMTLVGSSSRSSLLMEGEVAGTRAELLLECDPMGESNASLWTIESVVLDLHAYPSRTFTLRARPHRLALESRPVEPTHTRSSLDLPHEYEVEGSVDDARAFLSSEVRDALARALIRRSVQMGDSLGWFEVVLGDHLRFEGLGLSLGKVRVAHLVYAWPELLTYVEALVRAWPEGLDAPTLLLERVEAGEEPIAQRWHAASALLGTYPESEATRRMRDEAASIEAWVGALCALNPLEEGATYASLKHALVSPERFMRREFGAWLGRHFPWETFVDTDLLAEVREPLFTAAIEAAPEDPEPGLLALFTSRLDPNEDAARLFRRVRAAVWTPSPEASVRLARDAVMSIRHELVFELHEREVTNEDIPLLAALTQSGHQNDITQYIAQLTEEGAFGSGFLSLAEGDETHGRLSPTGSVGDLTPADD